MIWSIGVWSWLLIGHRQVLKVQLAQLGAVTLNVTPMQVNVTLFTLTLTNANECNILCRVDQM